VGRNVLQKVRVEEATTFPQEHFALALLEVLDVGYGFDCKSIL